MKMDEDEDDQPVFFPKPDGLCSAGILITDKNTAAVCSLINLTICNEPSDICVPRVQN